MTSTRIRKARLRLSLLAAGVAPVVALLGPVASTAHADTTDDAFVKALSNHGITHESAQSEIMAGHLVCHQLDMGKTQQQVADDVMSSSTLDGDNAGYFVEASILAYCPKYD
jgi:Protein of unknown function (DUF732)